MPIIILGLIVVLGVVFLLYYQLGSSGQDKIKSGFSNFFSGIFGGPQASPGGPAGGDSSAEGGPEGADSDASGQQSVKSLTGDEKVLYIFGDGAREERPLDSDDGKDGKE